MKLNLGCGFNKLDGWINADSSSTCKPDIVVDLESTPWIWESDSATSVLFNHSLEHLGKDPAKFLELMQELYRVCAPDCTIEINVPHPRHNNFLDDPTHVRPITPRLLSLFSKQLNAQWQQTGEPYTQLGLYLDVDFEVVEAVQVPEEPYLSEFQNNSLSISDLEKLARENNNVISEYRIVMKAKK